MGHFDELIDRGASVSSQEWSWVDSYVAFRRYILDGIHLLHISRLKKVGSFYKGEI